MRLFSDADLLRRSWQPWVLKLRGTGSPRHVPWPPFPPIRGWLAQPLPRLGLVWLGLAGFRLDLAMVLKNGGQRVMRWLADVDSKGPFNQNAPDGWGWHVPRF